MGKILVPLDGSPAAQAIVPFILEVAGPLNMAVRLLRVVEPISSMAVEGVVLVDDFAARVRAAEEYLAALAAELRDRGIDAEWEVRRGRAALTIVRIRRPRVMSNRHRSDPRLLPCAGFSVRGAS